MAFYSTSESKIDKAFSKKNKEMMAQSTSPVLHQVARFENGNPVLLNALDAQIAQDFLTRLKQIFPNLEEQYLERISGRAAVSGQSLQNIVEDILNYEEVQVRTNKPEIIDLTASRSNAGNIACTSSYLVSEAKAEQTTSTPSSLVSETKAEQITDLAKVKSKIEEFLKRFPEPRKYFTEQNKGFEYSINSRLYLKNKYRWLRMAEIDRVFRTYNYNLTLACIVLDQCTEKQLKALRPLSDALYLDIDAFHDEVTYIENKSSIDSYLKEKELERMKKFQEEKLAGALLECSICCNDELFTSEVATCREGHIFCKDCIRSGAKNAVEEGKGDLICFENNCDQEFILPLLQDLLDPSVFSRMIAIKQTTEVTIADIEGLAKCPFCDYAAILPSEMLIFACDKCNRTSCRLCQEEEHYPRTCDQVEKRKDVAARKFIEDKMTDAIVRECPRCRRRFTKEDGCNKIACQCGALLCFICRKIIKNYDHFVSNKNPTGCPLYSDFNVLNVEVVEVAARRAKEQVLQENNGNFTLLNDPTELLPKRIKLSKREQQLHRDGDGTVNKADVIERIINSAMDSTPNQGSK